MSQPPPCHQLESDDVRDVEAYIFDGEELLLAVENRAAATVSTWRLCRHQQNAAVLPRVNSIGKFCLLYNTTINLYLLQTTKCRLQTPVPSIPDDERAEP